MITETKTGPLQVNNTPGLFIKKDHCLGYLLALITVLEKIEETALPISLADYLTLADLKEELSKCTEGDLHD